MNLFSLDRKVINVCTYLYSQSHKCSLYNCLNSELFAPSQWGEVFGWGRCRRWRVPIRHLPIPRLRPRVGGHCRLRTSSRRTAVAPTTKRPPSATASTSATAMNVIGIEPAAGDVTQLARGEWRVDMRVAPDGRSLRPVKAETLHHL